MFVCFLPYHDSRRENFGKKIRWKIFPKNGKRLNCIQIFWIWVVRELPLPSIVQVIQSAHAWTAYEQSYNISKAIVFKIFKIQSCPNVLQFV